MLNKILTKNEVKLLTECGIDVSNMKLTRSQVFEILSFVEFVKREKILEKSLGKNFCSCVCISKMTNKNYWVLLSNEIKLLSGFLDSNKIPDENMEVFR